MNLTINDAVGALNQAIPSNLNIQVLPSDSQNACTWLWGAGPGQSPGHPAYVAQTAFGPSGPTGYPISLTTTFWLGSPGWDTTAGTFETAVFKAALHEEGHAVGLIDQPTDASLDCGGQVQGEFVMNDACGVNDSEDWSPTQFTGCDTNGIINAYSGTVRLNLSAEYLLREGSGTVVYDNSGNELHGAFVAGHEPSWIGDGLQFTAADQSVQVPDAVLANGPLYDFTLEVWANVACDTDGGDYGRVSLADSNLVIALQPVGLCPVDGGWFWTELWSATTLIARLGVGYDQVPVGIWCQLAVARIGDTVALYINGVAVDSGSGYSTDPVDLASSNGGKYIGADQDSGWTGGEGAIGEVRFYAAGLTDVQVAQNYNARKSAYGY